MLKNTALLFQIRNCNPIQRKLIIAAILLSLVLFGFWIRFSYINPTNLLFGYDQYHSLFYTRKIVSNHDLVVIGTVAAGNQNLHHGAFFFYYNAIPYFLFNKNPVFIAHFNAFFNALSIVILFFLSYSIFGKKLPGLIAAFLAAVSFEYVKFSGWISNPTVTLMLIPLFFLGLWKYYQNNRWGLPFAAFILGITIQSEIYFVYLLPITLLYFLVFRPRIPGLRLALTTVFSLAFSLSTMIVVELRQNFSGIRSILNPETAFSSGEGISERLGWFLRDFWLNFANNLYPQEKSLGIVFGLVVIVGLLIVLSRRGLSKNERQGIYFLLLYLFSPFIMFFLGYHDAAWFFIGLPPAIILTTGYLLSKIQPLVLMIFPLTLISFNNLDLILNKKPSPNTFYNIDESSLLTSQIKVMDYIYKDAMGEPFAINSVTYPLYQNEVWAYDFDWYGMERYHYLPAWLGGDQVYPYNTLSKSKGDEKYFYMIIDDTYNIPELYKDEAKRWVRQAGRLVEENRIGGFIIQKGELEKRP